MTAEALKANEYQCCKCKGIFEKGWSDAEAAAELTELYPGFGQNECELICEDCNKQFLVWFNEQKQSGQI